ncbi:MULTISPECIES: hypothetical protein [unclassified Inquilinus]|uniref:hypothetical protein n=1 Tax=unclassified Inquilinus TaxID=2645927 RepID=UPI003F8F772D
MNEPHSVTAGAEVAPADPDRDRAERGAQKLDRLAEMAMEQAEIMHQALLSAARADDAAKAKEFGLAFDRAARGVRRAVALQAQLARQRREEADKAAAGSRARAEDKAGRRRQVARAVVCSLADDRGPDTEQAKAGVAKLWERLVEDPEIDAGLALAEHPLEEIVFHLCRDMGIHPDPAWLDPGYSGADWESYRRLKQEDRGAEDRGAEDPPDPAGPCFWPQEGEAAGRYWYLKPSAKAPGVVTGWHDIETQERLDRPPWELPGGPAPPVRKPPQSDSS